MREPGWSLRLYRGAAPLLAALPRLGAPFSTKLARGVAGRRGLSDRLAAAAERLQGCIWIHVTSVGEYEQARPIVAALRSRGGPAARPIAITHFSPSGYEYAIRRPCGDFHDYLPFDHPTAMARLVQSWNPRLLLFVKFDCWPNQVLAAHQHGVPIFLLAGSLQPQSARLHPLARPLYRDLFDRFTHLGVCTAEDRRRFVTDLGVSAPVSITGDTRIEQVIVRYEASRDGAAAQRLRQLGGRLLVIGSSWPADERIWLPVLPALLQHFADLRVVLVPHEPSPDRIAALTAQLNRRAIGTVRLTELMATAPAATSADDRCVLVDTVGVLAEIYRAGSLAYVGGSFTTGVHNTMEPAIASLPVLFGPKIQNAEEAADLVARGAGWIVRRPAEARERTEALLQDPGKLSRCGGLARQVVLDQRGATEKSLAVLAPYL